LNNERAEVRDSAVGNVADQCEEEEEICFDVGEGFDDLVGL
jgi:hypothetical protein